MKNIKIKAYSLKKNTSIDKNVEKKSEVSQTGNPTFATNNNGMLIEMDKILKSPSLNISQKFDSKGILTYYKGNRSININLFEKHVKNNIIDVNQTLKLSKDKLNESNSNLNTKANKELTTQALNNNIKIKLNINSEVINNNFKITDKSAINVLKEGGIVNSKNDNNLKENGLQNNNIKTINYYKEQITLKEKTIDKLQQELEEAKSIIQKLSQESMVKKPSQMIPNEETSGTKDIILHKEFKKNSITLKSHLMNVSNNTNVVDRPSKPEYREEVLHTTENNKKKEDTDINNHLNFTNKDSYKIVDSNDYFRKSNKIVNSDDKKQSKQVKTVEELLKSTARLLEKNPKEYITETPKNQERTFSSFTRNKGDAFLKTEETLKKIRTRTQELLEKYSQNLISLSASKIKK